MNAHRHDPCDAVLASISAFLDGELDRPACDVIEQHCRHCVRCAALLSGLRDTVGLCRDAAAEPLPESVRQRAQDSVRRLLEDDTTS